MELTDMLAGAGAERTPSTQGARFLRRTLIQAGH